MPSPTKDSPIHEKWMSRCLELAQQGAGYVSPNPMVGCVVIGQDGELLGEGWHQSYGGPHAERNAIEDAEKKHSPDALRHATLYVNLEPCSHFGKTPPCAHLILEKGIPRVVIGMIDPYKKVRGQGIALLRENGLEVCVGVLRAPCERLNEAFTHHTSTGRPLVSLKIAQTLDGRVATNTGHSQWISGEASRKLVHRWRAQLDAVMVGSGTALHDNPSLTVRHVAGRQPLRVVLDRTGSLPKSLNLFADTFAGKTIAVIAAEASPAYEKPLLDAGGEILRVSTKQSHLDLHELLCKLGESTNNRNGLQSLLVEAGPALATALLTQDLVNHFYLFIAPKVIGKGIPTFNDLSIEKMTEALTFQESSWQQIGNDMLFTGYTRKV